MHKLLAKWRSFAVIVASALVLIVTPAAAQHGADSGGSGSGSDSTTTTTTTETPASPTTTETQHRSGSQTTTSKTETETESSTTEQTETEDVHVRGAALVAELRHKNGDKQKSPEERQKMCEGRKNGMTHKMKNIGNQAQKAQDRIDNIYAKALAYQAKNNISSTELTTLEATADAAKAVSASAVANLKATTPTIDCTSSTTANDIAAYQVTVKDTRQKLKAYRSAVRAVLVALASQAKPESTEAQGGN